MPQITVNLGAVEAFENLPYGSYLGDISRIKLMQPTQAGKFAQLMVTYLVVDGDCLGKKQSEWISMSPKAAFRLKKWFAKFGLGDTESFNVDDDTEELIDPNLIGARVIFVVKPDAKNSEMIRTELLSVEEMNEAPVAPVRAAPRRAPAQAAPTPPTFDAEANEAAEAARAKAEKLAEARAALAALEAEEIVPTAEQVETAKAVPTAIVPRRPAAPIADQPQPVRRTLR